MKNILTLASYINGNYMNNFDPLVKSLSQLQDTSPNKLVIYKEKDIEKLGKDSHNIIAYLFWQIVSCVLKRYQDHFKVRGYTVIEKSNLLFLKDRFGIQEASLTPEERKLVHEGMKGQFVVKNWYQMQRLHRHQAIEDLKNNGPLLKALLKVKPDIYREVKHAVESMDPKKTDKTYSSIVERLITLCRSTYSDPDKIEHSRQELVKAIRYIARRQDVASTEELLTGVEERVLFHQFGKDLLTSNDLKKIRKLIDADKTVDDEDVRRAVEFAKLLFPGRKLESIAPEQYYESAKCFLSALNSLKDHPRKSEMLEAIKNQPAVREIIAFSPKQFKSDLAKVTSGDLSVAQLTENYNIQTLEQFIKRISKGWSSKIQDFIKQYAAACLSDLTKQGKGFYGDDPALQPGGHIAKAGEVFVALKTYRKIVKTEEEIEKGIAGLDISKPDDVDAAIDRIKTACLRNAKKELWKEKLKNYFPDSLIEQLTDWADKAVPGADRIDYALMVEKLTTRLIGLRRIGSWIKAEDQYLFQKIIDFLPLSNSIEDMDKAAKGLLDQFLVVQGKHKSYFSNRAELEVDVKQLQFIGSLKLGELLKPNLQGFYKELPPTSIFWKLIDLIQRLIDPNSNQRAFKAISNVVKNAKEHIDKLNKLPLPVDPSVEIYMLMNLQKSLLETTDTNTGLNALKKTLAKTKSKKDCSSIDPIITAISNELKPLVDQRLQTLLSSDQYQKTKDLQPKVLEDVIAGIMTPKANQTANDDLESPWHIQLFSRDLVEKTFFPAFGEDYVKDIMKFYGLENQHATPVFTSRDIKALTLSLIANLTAKDVEQLVKQESLFSKKISQDRRQFIQDKLAKNEPLSEEELLEVLNVVRHIQVPEPSDSIDSHYEDQFRKDIAFINYCKLVKNYRDLNDDHLNDVKKFSFAEYLSRDIVYALCHNAKGVSDNSIVHFRDGVLFPLYDSRESKMVCKSAYSILGEKGLYSIMVAPSVKKSSNDPVDIQVVFRGTFDYDAALRDTHPLEKQFSFEVEGPGGKSFAKLEKQLIHQTLEGMKKVSRQLETSAFKMQFMGHSLGATDAQRMVAAFTLELARTYDALNRLSIHFPMSRFDIKGVELYAFNPPGVERTFNDNWLKVVNDRSLGSVPFHLRYFKTDSDFVQKGGAVLLGACENLDGKKKKIQTTVFKFIHAKRARNKIESYVNRFKARLMDRYDAHTRHTMTVENAKTTYLADVRTNNRDDADIRKGNHALVKTPFSTEEFDIARKALFTGFFTKSLNRSF